jgi:UDPglucose 6-dehydrogenase
MRIAVLGAGVVGLSTAARLAVLGHEVTVIDKDARRVASLCNGQLPFSEPGLEALLTVAAHAGQIDFGVDAASGLKQAEACFIAVSTPEKRGAPCLVHVRHAAEECARFAPRDCLVLVRSSLVVGTCEELAVQHERVFVAHPELSVRGNTAKKPQRLLAGTLQRGARRVISEIYEGLVDEGVVLNFCAPHEAELRSFADFRRAQKLEAEVLVRTA